MGCCNPWPNTVIAERLTSLLAHREMLDHIIGQQYTPYTDDAQVKALSPVPRLLQLFLYEVEERAHARALLARWQPPEGAHVLDVGCGTGSCAALLQAERPDLTFTLLNQSQVQLRDCPPCWPRVAATMHRLPLVDACVDAVLLAYTLGYGLVAPVLAEARRVLRPGGILILYDMVPKYQDADVTLVTLGYKCYPLARLLAATEQAGFFLQRYEPVPVPVRHPALNTMDPTLWQALRAEVVPILMLLEAGG